MCALSQISREISTISIATVVYTNDAILLFIAEAISRLCSSFALCFTLLLISASCIQLLPGFITKLRTSSTKKDFPMQSPKRFSLFPIQFGHVGSETVVLAPEP
ncbi:uncharacterized protein LOC125374828 [Haliotis rufescens]|uniref:uncharacterized protein LOC125374828 n=1 Tax=Haliotis rufescens TaxID=6454 RepID=UPI00201F6B46|nr:uncharacterized protein LOC125374828 [Haliotis rufescens]